MMVPTFSRIILCVALAGACGACSSTKAPDGGVGGNARDASVPTPGGISGNGDAIGSGGTIGSGGSAGSGGATGSGGKTSSGEATASGGAAGTGAAVASGGIAGSGGVAGATGDAPGSGGAGGNGDATASGGAAGTEGRAGSGGTTGPAASAGAGGRTDTGGTSNLGGRTGTGGTTSTGGATAAGGTTGAGGTNTLAASYAIGADVTNAESASAAAQDSLLSLMQAHGFNYVRLRTFVDPKATDGYDKTNGTADIAHTATFGKKIKDKGMGLLVDFHYSDNWADPGKQCVPVAWQAYTTIADLATAVRDYTKASISTLIAGGARPDMVQIGNETTPGMLIHVCDSGGQPTGNNQVTGSISNWTNLGTLFKAGVQGVKDVDTGILIALHIDRGGDKTTDTKGAALNTSKSYIDNAIKQGVQFDVFGESCYQQYQGDPNSTANTKTTWTNTFTGLATAYPNLKFMTAEYGPLQREINDVVFGLANKQGIGTFNWEPDTAGDWNRTADGVSHVLFTRSGNTYTAQPDLALYDQMKTDYASRL